VSGGSMANLTALAVARNVMLGDRFERAVVYCSDQTHSSIDRGLRVLGFHQHQLHRIASDAAFRLDMKAFRRAVESDRQRGLVPFCLVANAGTTNSGAIDPLPALADYCQHEGLWLHADGAYGAAAVFCEWGKQELRGLELVDSLALDPHKWLFQPFEIGCVLVRRSDWLRETFHILPEYLADIEGRAGEVNLCDYGVQLTRGFRALKLWMSLKFFGRAAFEAAQHRGFALAELAETTVERLPHWEVVSPAQLGVVTFRYAPQGVPFDSIDRLNHGLVAAVIQDGYAMLSSTVLRGMTVLRMCCINPRTTEQDVVETLERLDRMAKGLIAY
jgi:aromatic-L-amino-acid decarboxylase